MTRRNFSHIHAKTEESSINSEDSEEDLTCRKGLGWVLDNKHNQLIHEKSCTGAKYHQCGTCDHKFQNIHTLQNHMIRCQWSNDKTIPTCEFCSKKFINETNLDKHSKGCTATHKCNICNDNFNGAIILENHYKKCKKTLECKFCQKTFKSKSDFQTSAHWMGGGIDTSK